MTFTLNVSMVSSSYSNGRPQQQSALPASSEATRTPSIENAVNNTKAARPGNSSSGFATSGSMLAPGADADKLPNCGVKLPLDGKQLPPFPANNSMQIATDHQSADASSGVSPENDGLSTELPPPPAAPDQIRPPALPRDASPKNPTDLSLNVSIAGSMLAPGTDHDEQHDCGIALPVKDNQSVQQSDPASSETSPITESVQQPLPFEIPETVIRAEYYQPQSQLDENPFASELVKVSLPDLFELLERNTEDWQYGDFSYSVIDLLG